MSNLNSFIAFVLIFAFSIYGLYKLINRWGEFWTSIFGKLLKIIIAFILAISIVVCGIGAYINFNDYWVKERVKIFTEAEGIKLGISEADLIFLKGKSKNKFIQGEETTLFFENGLDVVLVDGIVSRVEIDCYSNRYKSSVVFGGISCGSELADVLKIYGEPNSISSSSDKTKRIYNYLKYNIAFVMSKSSVDEIIIFDSTGAKNGVIFIPEIPKPKKTENSLSKPSQSSKKDEPQSSDHCASNLSRSERLRRLALTGAITETSPNTYSNGKHFVSFIGSGSEVEHCR